MVHSERVHDEVHILTESIIIYRIYTRLKLQTQCFLKISKNETKYISNEIVLIKQ